VFGKAAVQDYSEIIALAPDFNQSQNGTDAEKNKTNTPFASTIPDKSYLDGKVYMCLLERTLKTEPLTIVYQFSPTGGRRGGSAESEGGGVVWDAGCL